MQWKAAAQEEIEAHIANGTWTPCPLPPGKTAIGCQWVLSQKFLSDGELERYKARLVAKGFTQIEGIDYTETFAPVSKFTSIRAILAIAAQEDLEIHQMDVKSAFLNGNLSEEIYMKCPPGFEADDSVV